MTAAVELHNFTLKIDKFILNNISFRVNTKEIVAIIGKTGAGKTLLLESISGAYHVNQGDILLFGKDMLSMPLQERDIGFVYQDFALFPHMTVFDNISYGLKMRKTPKNMIRERVKEIARILSIENILNHWPGTLSGGEKQRTALARALILRPKLILLDEPFSALDPVTKKKMYAMLTDIHQQFGCTIIFVSHDFEEASCLANRVGIMISGELVEIRETKNLFYPIGIIA